MEQLFYQSEQNHEYATEKLSFFNENHETKLNRPIYCICICLKTQQYHSKSVPLLQKKSNTYVFLLLRRPDNKMKWKLRLIRTHNLRWSNSSIFIFAILLNKEHIFSFKSRSHLAIRKSQKSFLFCKNGWKHGLYPCTLKTL